MFAPILPLPQPSTQKMSRLSYDAKQQAASSKQTTQARQQPKATTSLQRLQAATKSLNKLSS